MCQIIDISSSLEIELLTPTSSCVVGNEVILLPLSSEVTVALPGIWLPHER